MAKKQLSVFDKHQLAIARKTLTFSDAGALIMGGPSKSESRDIIARITGNRPACDCDTSLGRNSAGFRDRGFIVCGNCHGVISN